MALTYELLLDLYRGRSTAVEQITDPAQLSSLAVQTPVTALIEALDKGAMPKHIVLTGSAGDGKTFAAITTPHRTFQVITDASARRTDAERPPIEDLAGQIQEVLAGGKRLLLAINRGQLERLLDYTRSAGGLVRAFLEEVRARTVLRERWVPESGNVAVADLGLLDRSATVLAMADRIAAIPNPAQLAGPTREAFGFAQKAMQAPRVRDWLTLVTRAATSSGANVSMRQLWSFMSFIATGGRAPGDQSPLTLEDAVGARMFSPLADGALFEAARDFCDPSITPNAPLVKEAITGRLITLLRGSSLGPLSARSDSDPPGRVLMRVAAVHGFGAGRSAALPEDRFSLLVRQLLGMPAGWQRVGSYAPALVRGMYTRLGLWKTASVLPAWQALCYDASCLGGASSVANAELDQAMVALAVPRPPPEVEDQLIQAWRPPYIWLGSEKMRLRLSPTVFRGLLDATARLEVEELFAMERWLARSGRPVSSEEAPSALPKLRLARRGADDSVVLEDDLDEAKTAVTIEGGAA